MIYSYMLENTRVDINVENAPLIKALQKNRVDTDDIFIDPIDCKERPELRRLIKSVLSNGDTLIVRSIADLSNNLEDMLKTLEYLDALDVRVISIAEPYYSYQRYSAPLIDFLSIDTAWRSTKRALGIAKAKAEKRMGRKRVDPIMVADSIKMYNLGMKIEDIKRITHIAGSTLYRELQRMNIK